MDDHLLQELDLLGELHLQPQRDALRVKAKPEAAEYREVLTYEFPERKLDTATVALKWENLAVPFTITVDNPNDLYFENLSRELRSSPGFVWQNWLAAAQFTMASKTHLDTGLKWAQQATNPAFAGWRTSPPSHPGRPRNRERQGRRGREDHGSRLKDPTAQPMDLHLYGRRLLAAKSRRRR